MGGGSGGYFSSKPDELKRKLRDAEDRTRDEAHDSAVADILSRFLTIFNDRDTDAINIHLDEIKKALEREIEGTVDPLMGGSVAKHTYVDGLSDIDSLLILKDKNLAGLDPKEVNHIFAKQLKERFPKTEIKVGQLGVTVKFQDIDIQLLPAVLKGDSLMIADRTGKQWANIKPRIFSDLLTRVNKENGQKVVPIIKLAKGIIATLPEKQRISGYHAESLAIEIFKNYKGDRSLNGRLKEYFRKAPKLLNSKIRDKTGQSIHVDDYLGSQGSLERKIVVDAMSRVYRRMGNADSARSVTEWEKLFDE